MFLSNIVVTDWWVRCIQPFFELFCKSRIMHNGSITRITNQEVLDLLDIIFKINCDFVFQTYCVHSDFVFKWCQLSMQSEHIHNCHESHWKYYDWNWPSCCWCAVGGQDQDALMNASQLLVTYVHDGHAVQLPTILNVTFLSLTWKSKDQNTPSSCLTIAFHLCAPHLLLKKANATQMIDIDGRMIHPLFGKGTPTPWTLARVAKLERPVIHPCLQNNCFCALGGGRNHVWGNLVEMWLRFGFASKSSGWTRRVCQSWLCRVRSVYTMFFRFLAWRSSW